MQADDEAEFTALVDRHARFVFRVAYSLLRHPQDAEDAVQEMFLKLYCKRAWRGLRDERAFLARATWRMAIDKLRQRRPIRDGQEYSERADAAPNPECFAMNSEWREHVHAMVDHLPEELRQPLALSTVDEMTSREIGLVMGIPEGTVRTRLMRARQRLRDELAAMEKGQHAHGRR